MTNNDIKWKTIPGTNGLYEASTEGEIRRVGGKILKPGIRSGKYLAVNLSINGKRKSEYVHRLVAITFLGPIPGDCEVDHIDGNPSNNHLDNLRYLTHQLNASADSRMYKVSKPIRCENDERVYLNEYDAAKEYDVSASTIWRSATNGTLTKVGLKFAYISIEEYDKNKS